MPRTTTVALSEHPARQRVSKGATGFKRLFLSTESAKSGLDDHSHEPSHSIAPPVAVEEGVDSQAWRWKGLQVNYRRERFSCLVTAVDIPGSDSFVPVVVCSQGNW